MKLEQMEINKKKHEKYIKNEVSHSKKYVREINRKQNEKD